MISFPEFFDELLETIQHIFLGRKSDEMEFFFRRQIRFFENSYQAAHNEGKNHVCPVHIHSHLAFLIPPNSSAEDDNGFSLNFTEAGKILLYQRKLPVVFSANIKQSVPFQNFLIALFLL